ncbi:hypothetical protein ACPX19_02770 [Winogradskyella sp. HB-48]|uniref:hypothetical protein n=1 Tax=Winogradskyella sp. HB-48 TaxID=3416808 RepID=UPI003CF7E881
MRLYLYRQDIQDLNQVSEKEALNIMRDIREEYKLAKKRYVSVYAYCKFFMVTREEVYDALQLKKTG